MKPATRSPAAVWTLLLSVAIGGMASATVIHVPADWPTIQQGLDELLSNDTLLVDTGEYIEAPVAPPIAFWLIGNVPADTGDFTRPTLDASLTPDSVHRGCLLLPENSVATVERMRFRNRFPMSPRNVAGGVTLSTNAAAFRDCLFDSTEIGLYQDHADSGRVIVDHCVFRNNRFVAVYFSSTTVHATDCLFDGCTDGTNWYQLICGPESVVENCHFRGGHQTALANWGNPNVAVRNCIFGPDSAVQYFPVELIDYTGLFENNLFADLQLYSHTVSAVLDCRGESVFRGNTFYNCRGMPDPPRFDNLLTINCHISGDSGYVWEDNVMAACTTNGGSATAIWASGNGRFFRNRIHDLPAGMVLIPAISGSGPDTLVFRQNLFYNTGYAMRAQNGQTTDARRNWWGHSTGPYHPVLNPNGLGDQISDGVIFDSWLQDTILTAADTPPVALPGKFALEAYPNPFNSTVRLRLIPNEIQIVKVELFDVLGRKVKEIWGGPLAFQKDINFDGSALASGIYFANVTNAIFRRPLATTKLLLIK